jgi:hypothetical protein
MSVTVPLWLAVVACGLASVSCYAKGRTHGRYQALERWHVQVEGRTMVVQRMVTRPGDYLSRGEYQRAVTVAFDPEDADARAEALVRCEAVRDGLEDLRVRAEQAVAS